MKRAAAAPIVRGLVLLSTLAGCSTAPSLLDEQRLRSLRTVDVAIDVPDSNFVYHRVDTASGMPYVAPSGVSVGTALATNIFFGVLVATIDKTLAERDRDASLPVSQSVRDLDLRGMAFGQLKDMSVASPHAPTLSLSTLPFPRVEEPPPVSPPQPMLNPTVGVVRLDPLKPMAERAATAQTDATLFVRVVPVFTLGTSAAPTVQGAAWLFDRSGRLLHTWSISFVGPPSPDLERTQAVAWWADARYRRLIAQGIRAVMLPLGEDLTQPGLVARRRLEMERSAAALGAQAGRLESTRGGSVISGTQVSAANAQRMRSSACLVDSDGPRISYRYERPSHNEHLVVSGYCPGETLDLWSHDLVPGMSWLSEQTSAPRVTGSAN